MFNPISYISQLASSAVNTIGEPYLQALTHLKFAVCGRVDKASQRVFNKRVPIRRLSLTERALHLIAASVLTHPWVNIIYQKFIPKIDRRPTSPIILKDGVKAFHFKKSVSFDNLTVEKKFYSYAKLEKINSWSGLSYGRLKKSGD